VAVYADNHYLVSKMIDNGRTRTEVTLLSGDTRVDEIARMLGGAFVTDKSREHAAELILSASDASGQSK